MIGKLPEEENITEQNPEKERGNKNRRVIGLKQAIGWFLVFMLLFSTGSILNPQEKRAASWENPYTDVTEELWSYDYIKTLSQRGILPESETFEPAVPENRGDFVLSLYNMENEVFPKAKKAHKKETPPRKEPKFTDVEKKTDLWDAVRWAYQWGLTDGTSQETFSPAELVTREQACTILTRFAALEEMELSKKVEPQQFVDSLNIAAYARSGVTACQMAGLVNGYEDGYFYPQNTIQRQECAALLCRIITAAETEEEDTTEGAELVDLTAGAYDSLYDTYEDLPFTALIPESEEGPIEYFAKTAFIGDSVSVMLQSYCAATGALGDATFLCAGSMSPPNMMNGQILPEYPVGSGEHPPIADSVAACGAQVVYVMLGINSLEYLGPQGGAESLATLLDTILEKNPDISIVIESMTPMADSSTSYSNGLNNNVINQYNEILMNLCQERKWYFLNVREAVLDENGFLKKEYCSDYGGMGMHFTFDGTKVWTDYLKTHIPAALL